MTDRNATITRPEHNSGNPSNSRMKLIMFSVYDQKAEAFIQPFFAPMSAMGVRMFAAACNDPKQDFNRFAEDYTLFELGSINTITGELTSLNTPKSLGLAVTHITKEETS